MITLNVFAGIEDSEFGSLSELREWMHRAAEDMLGEAAGGAFEDWEPELEPLEGEVVRTLTLDVEPLIRRIMADPEAEPEWEQGMRKFVSSGRMEQCMQECYEDVLEPMETRIYPLDICEFLGHQMGKFSVKRLLSVRPDEDIQGQLDRLIEAGVVKLESGEVFLVKENQGVNAWGS